MKRQHYWIGVAMVSLWAAEARAAGPLFSEDWESASATSNWTTADGNPITVASDSGAVCSTKFQRETIPYGGGRALSTIKPAITPGNSYCMTAYVRGSTGTQPFLGINAEDGAGTIIMQHWLIGSAGYDNGYGGTAVPVIVDGVWHWYAAPFTAAAGENALGVVDELWQNGGAGSADFDDIQLWAGACPGAPSGVDAHQTCANPTPICDSTSSDSSYGACLACTSNSQCAPNLCSGGSCLACTTDAQCGGTTSGMVCDGGSHTCVAGCRGGAGNGCPAGLFCSNNDTSGATYGACTTSCNFDSQCSAPTPLCLADATDAGTSMCVQCRADGDCSGGKPVCDPGGRVCVECTSGNTSACSAAGNGAVCLANESCGCNSDSDCGAADSGRICNTATNKCATGCRGTGGNGCPSGMTCSSTTASPGTCMGMTVVGDMATGPRDMSMQPPVDDLGVNVVADMGAPAPDLSQPVKALAGGGCGCDLGGHGGSDAAAICLVALAALVLTRRRRRA
jgi:hypothetical protein